MSASIYWKPVAPASGSVPVWGPSLFVEAMKEAFGNCPWTLGPEDLSVLKGLAAGYGNSGGSENPYRYLIQKIQHNGEARTIQVWPEY